MRKELTNVIIDDLETVYNDIYSSVMSHIDKISNPDLYSRVSKILARIIKLEEKYRSI